MDKKNINIFVFIQVQFLSCLNCVFNVNTIYIYITHIYKYGFN